MTDPLQCPSCGNPMAIVKLVTREIYVVHRSMVWLGNYQRINGDHPMVYAATTDVYGGTQPTKALTERHVLGASCPHCLRMLPGHYEPTVVYKEYATTIDARAEAWVPDNAMIVLAHL